MLIFVRPDETEIIAVGVAYLRIEGAFYCGIGILFLLYGYYRAIRMPGMSVVLTVLSLGTRVVLSYWLASIPEDWGDGHLVSIPIGWLIATWSVSGAIGMLKELEGVKRKSGKFAPLSFGYFLEQIQAAWPAPKRRERG